MIGKKSKILIICYMLFLIVLFLMCSTDLIIREPEKEVYQVAVIIEDVQDDHYGNFRKGMDQAAIEFNADVRFITLYEKMNAKQQIELIHREQLDGVDALIVAPVEEEEVALLAGKQGAVPFVLLSAGETQEKAVASIFVDYRKMGGQLAENMLERIPENALVLAIEEPFEKNAVGNSFLGGAAAVLENSGRKYRTIELGDEEAYQELLTVSAEQEIVLLAGSQDILSAAAEMLAQNREAVPNVRGLYGYGNTLSVLNYLDKGIISGICVTDEFSRGYFSVYMAIQELEGKVAETPLEMDSYYIEREDLRKPEYEKLLFPVE